MSLLQKFVCDCVDVGEILTEGYLEKEKERKQKKEKQKKRINDNAKFSCVI